MNGYRGKAAILFAGLVLVLSFPVFGEEKQEKTSVPAGDSRTAKSKESTSRLFAYKPPMRGKPGNRVGGGTRGADSDMPVVAVLVPDHTGLTTRGNPVLYWYLSVPTRHRIEFTLNDDRSIEPLIEVELKNPGRGGIHSISLSDYGYTLLKGIEYQWFVTVVRDQEQRSKDIIATGMIKHIEPSPGLAGEIGRADKTEIPYIYAEHGIWYETVSSLSELIMASPSERRYQEMRSELLRQAGLPEVAAQETE